MDDNIKCSPEDIAGVLQYSLAVIQYHKPPSDNEQYNLHYDATQMLAYALDNVLKREEFDHLPWGTSKSEAIGSGSECNCLADYTLRGFAPMLLRKYLLVMNLTGLSVSTLCS